MRVRIVAAMWWGMSMGLVASCYHVEAIEADIQEPSIEEEDDDESTTLCPATYGIWHAHEGLCFQSRPGEQLRSFRESMVHCRNLTTGGHSDWVLPTPEQIVTLLGGCDETVLNGGYGMCDRCAWSSLCQNLLGADDHAYWTSSILEHTTDIAWYVDFGSGAVGTVHQGFRFRTRCVRDLSGTVDFSAPQK